VNVLCRNVALDRFDPEVIVGISRGGLTPGVMISHWMNLPFKPIQAALRDFPEWEDYLPRGIDKRG
jgi:hypoxanthine phosphoribosyltransferase